MDKEIGTKEEEKYIWFDGTRYTRQKDGRYIGSYGKLLHRAVWTHYNGEIPKGYVIHHIDGNPSNNDISNLELLSMSEHQKLHNQNNSIEIFPCDYCGKRIELKRKGGRPHHFCSPKCQHRFDFENNREIRIWAECGKEFSAYKKGKTKYCSKECLAKVNGRAHRKKK